MFPETYTYAGPDVIFNTSQVLTLVVSAIWGTIRLVEYRKTMESQYEHKEDNKWGFGQVVPLILLLAPLLPTFELAFNSISNCTYGCGQPHIHKAHTDTGQTSIFRFG